MTKVSCDVVRDLLPLYYDGVCSDDSKTLIERHLSTCDSCKLELGKIKNEIELPKEEIDINKLDGKPIKNISAFWQLSKTRAFVKGVIITTITSLVIVLGYYGLFEWNVANVPTDVIKITNVSKVTDDRIVFHVELTDGYVLNRVKYGMDEDGNFYLTPLRPIIKEKAQKPYGLAKGYDFFDLKGQENNRNGAKIKAVYYGTPKDKILIWKKGMDLPKASEEIKKSFVEE